MNIRINLRLLCGLALAFVVSFGQSARSQDKSVDKRSAAATEQETSTPTREHKLMKATFGGGCFWCTEAIFEDLKGVSDVQSGYAGGTKPDPTYKQVCNGDTGHAEVIQITYDPDVVTYEKLLEVFFKTHDPTTLNRQGADHGTQYRSVIFAHDEEQQATAERIKKALDESGAYDRPIVTQIVPATTFYPAEDYHQDYFRKNPDAGYCQFAIRPKLDKFKKVFAESLKEYAR
jgi:peptide-methionine (S)-S-oxide reductase